MTIPELWRTVVREEEMIFEQNVRPRWKWNRQNILERRTAPNETRMRQQIGMVSQRNTGVALMPRKQWKFYNLWGPKSQSNWLELPSWHAGRTNHITTVNETACVCKHSRPRFGYHNGVGADTVRCSFWFCFVILDGSYCRTGLWGKTSRVCIGWCLWIGTLNCRSAMDLNWQSQEWEWVYLWTGRSQECKGILIWIIADNDAIGLGATRSSCDSWKRLDRRSGCGSSHTTNLCEKMGDDVLNLLYLHKSEWQQLAMNWFGYHFAVASETTGVCWRNGVSIFLHCEILCWWESVRSQDSWFMTF